MKFIGSPGRLEHLHSNHTMCVQDKLNDVQAQIVTIFRLMLLGCEMAPLRHVWIVLELVLPPLCAATSIQQVSQGLMAGSRSRRPLVWQQIAVAAQRREAMTECVSPAVATETSGDQ